MNLDPRSVPVRVVRNAGRILAFVALGLFTGGGGRPPPSALLGFVGLGVAAVVTWEVAYVRRFSYEVTPDTFDIVSGVLSRRSREIPYERVQNVDISQNVLQRALGVAELRIETAGGSSSEAALRYVSREEAARLQELLGDRQRRERAGGESSAAPDPAAETLFTLSIRELAVLGVVSADLRLLGLATVVLSVFAPALGQQLQPGPTLVSLTGPALGLVAIVGLWALSGARSVLRYYGFELRREGDQLRYERGLFQRYSGTIPTEKVQTLRLTENALARSLGYAGLVIETAGYGPDQTGGAQSAVPIARRGRALSLAQEIEPVGDVSFDRPPRRARTRYAVRYALVAGAAVAALWAANAVTGRLSLWYLGVGLVLAVPPAAHLAWRNRGYDAGEDYLVTENGFWRRQTVVVPYDRVQTVASTQTVFQRRRDLATVRVDTASSGGVFGTEAVAADIDAHRAEQLREDVADRLQRALRRRGQERRADRARPGGGVTPGD